MTSEIAKTIIEVPWGGENPKLKYCAKWYRKSCGDNEKMKWSHGHFCFSCTSYWSNNKKELLKYMKGLIWGYIDYYSPKSPKKECELAVIFCGKNIVDCIYSTPNKIAIKHMDDEEIEQLLTSLP